MERFKVTNISCITTDYKNYIDLNKYLKNQCKILLDDNKIYKRPRIVYTPKKTHIFEIYDEILDSDTTSLLYIINKKLDLILLNFNTN